MKGMKEIQKNTKTLIIKCREYPIMKKSRRPPLTPATLILHSQQHTNGCHHMIRKPLHENDHRTGFHSSILPRVHLHLHIMTSHFKHHQHIKTCFQTSFERSRNLRITRMSQFVPSLLVRGALTMLLVEGKLSVKKLFQLS